MTKTLAVIARVNAAETHATRKVGPLIWTTAEGERIPITAMATRHLFNAMKMTFNHLADMWGGEPVWFNHRYSDFATAALTGPDRLARMVVLMLRELQTRNDMPAHYIEPLGKIIAQLRGRDPRGLIS